MALLSVSTMPNWLGRGSERERSLSIVAGQSGVRGMTRIASLFVALAAFAIMAAPASAQKAQTAPAVGGPFLSVSSAKSTDKADPQFRALFNSWKQLDSKPQAVVAIPSSKPVTLPIALSSGFGVRSDPFRGGAAMHSGVDIPGPVGTPIYATADGIIGRTGWVGGYGNLVEIEHGGNIQTRYGHLSSIIATPGTRVKRGQLIGLMGSTGRSTGSHLHYEVRLEGRAVNPTPFLRTDSYLLAMERRASGSIALGGPAKAE